MEPEPHDDFNLLDYINATQDAIKAARCRKPNCARLRGAGLKYCQPCANGIRRRMRESVLRDCGMVKVRDSQGHVLWK